MRIKIMTYMDMPQREYSDKEVYDWLCEGLSKKGTSLEYNPAMPILEVDNIMWSFENE